MIPFPEFVATELAADALVRAVLLNGRAARYERAAQRVDAREVDHPLSRAFRRAAHCQRIAGLVDFAFVGAGSEDPERVAVALARRLEFGTVLVESIHPIYSEMLPFSRNARPRPSEVTR